MFKWGNALPWSKVNLRRKFSLLKLTNKQAKNKTCFRQALQAFTPQKSFQQPQFFLTFFASSHHTLKCLNAKLLAIRKRWKAAFFEKWHSPYEQTTTEYTVNLWWICISFYLYNDCWLLAYSHWKKLLFDVPTKQTNRLKERYSKQRRTIKHKIFFFFLLKWRHLLSKLNKREQAPLNFCLCG